MKEQMHEILMNLNRGRIAVSEAQEQLLDLFDVSGSALIINNMKRVQLFNTMESFEEFINRTDIEVIQVDVKVVEQSRFFQQNFAAVVFYKLLS